MNEPYDIHVAPAAARAIQDKLRENVAAAVIEFITGSLRANPRRVGKPLTREPRGRYAARRGTFRITYSIDDAEHLITVLRIEHRSTSTACGDHTPKMHWPMRSSAEIPPCM